MFDLDINFSAIFLSGSFAFILGMIWYHPKIMGARWMEVRGVKQDNMTSSPLPYIASFFLWLMAACFYAFMANFLDINTFSGYFVLSCLIWVAFCMPPALMGALYTGYPVDAVAIDTSYQLGGYYVFAAVHILFLYFGLN